MATAEAKRRTLIEKINTYLNDIDFRSMDIDTIKANFCKMVEGDSDLNKTHLAMYALRFHCCYDPNIDLANFYLSQMIPYDDVPIDITQEHPLLHELAHQCLGSRSSEKELLLILIKHPCYAPYLYNKKYTDKYGFTFLERLLFDSRDVKKSNKIIADELRKLFPKEFEKVLNKVKSTFDTQSVIVKQRHYIDPINIYFGRFY